MNADAWKPVFAFLEGEARFQAAAAAITGAAAAWWLKGLLAPPPQSSRERHPQAARIAASLLAVSAFLFFLDQGRLSKKYGDLARMLALGQEPPPGWADNLVRNFSDPAAVLQWLPYFVARILLFVVGFIVLWMLFAKPQSDSTSGPPA
jgi:hypothetical protein